MDGNRRQDQQQHDARLMTLDMARLHINPGWLLRPGMTIRVRSSSRGAVPRQSSPALRRPVRATCSWRHVATDAGAQLEATNLRTSSRSR
jgi:hypothetical protein